MASMLNGVGTSSNNNNNKRRGEEVREDDATTYLLEMFDSNHDEALDHSEFEALYDNLFGEHEDDHEDEHADDDLHDEDHDDHEEEDHEKDEDHDHEENENERRGAVDDGHDHDLSGCAEPTELFEEYDVNGDNVLTVDELEPLTSEFIVMLLNGCAEGDDGAHDDHGHGDDEDCKPPTTAEKWGYSFLAVIVISLISVVGIVLLPVKDPKIKNHIVRALIAFAVGTLFGDTVLHLLPLVWGLHGHGGSGDLDDDEQKVFVLTRGCAVFGGLIFFLILETIIHHVTHRVQRNFVVKHARHHRRGDLEMDDKASSGESSASISLDSGDYDSEADLVVVPPEPVTSWAEIEAVGWLNLVSDAAHNFTDGLALGAAFSVSVSTGLATSIAVALHEIPQEFADFAILLHSGFSKNWAIIWNLLSACWSFLGLILGLTISNVDDAQEWILAITAGNFLYIALVDMLPILLKVPRWRRLVSATFFITVGFVIMFVLAWFEDDFGGCHN
jgi:solute carrier family 39 (zinc transporter), member 4